MPGPSGVSCSGGRGRADQVTFGEDTDSSGDVVRHDGQVGRALGQGIAKTPRSGRMSFRGATRTFGKPIVLA